MALPARYRKPRFWIQMVLAIVIGLTLPRLLRPLIGHVSSINQAHGLLAGLIYLMIGVVMGIGYLIESRAGWSRFQATMISANFFVGGIMLLAPVIGRGTIGPQLSYGLFLLFFGLTYLTNRLAMRDADEMMKQMVADMMRLSYSIFSVFLMLYGAAYSLRINRALDPWGLTAILMLVHLGAGIWAGARRGIGKELEA